MNRKIAVVGVGNMAGSIISGAISSGLDSLSIEVFNLYDKCNDACKKYAKDEKFNICSSLYDAVASSDCVLLSVKPQNFPEVLEQICLVPNHESKMYITIAAGITSKSICDKLGARLVIRALPNLPMMIGKGVTAICKNDNATEDEFAFAVSLFASAGSTLVIDESQMNRTIGVTSSSPAYVFKFIDAIFNGASAQGLDDDDLIGTICDMVIGSAEMLKASHESPKKLIERVASKGGTTEQALKTLEENDFDEIIKNAMIACTNRADELGR